MNIWDIPPVVLNDELCICVSEVVRQCPEEWYCRAGRSKCSSTSPQQVAQMPSASRKRSKCSCRTKKQQREAAERRRTFIISRRVWSEGWSWVKSEAVREPTQVHLNFIQLPQKVRGVGGVVFPTAEQEEEKSTQRGGRVWTLWNISTGWSFLWW